MSTPGKVLVVLVLLIVPIWIVLAASVARLNAEWTLAVRTLKDDIAKLEASVADNARQVQSLTDDVALAQEASEAEQIVTKAKIAEVERGRAEMIQVQTAVANQLDTLRSAVQTAEIAKTQREQEKMAVQSEKAATEAAVKKLMDENSQLMSHLANLRKEFKETFEANKRLVEQLLRKAGRSPAQRTSFSL